MQTSITKVTNEHETWKSDLAFYRDEIKFFKEKLDEVSKANNKHPVIEYIEHFQNLLDIHESKLGELNHAIAHYEHDIVMDAKTHANHITKETAAEFERLKGKMERTTKLHLELKEDFRKFLERVL